MAPRLVVEAVTPVHIIWFIAAVFLSGSVVGVGLFLLLAEGIHRRGVFAGQAQAESAHCWRVDEFQPLPLPKPRWWAWLDGKPVRVLPQPPRPGFHDDRLSR